MSAEKVNTTMQQVENLQLRFGYGLNVLGALFEAMAYGASDLESYTDAVYGVYDYLQGINKEMSGVLEAYYGSSRKPSGDGN